MGNHQNWAIIKGFNKCRIIELRSNFSDYLNDQVIGESDEASGLGSGGFRFYGTAVKSFDNFRFGEATEAS